MRGCALLTLGAAVAATMMTATPAAAVVTADSPVFINEIHYDDEGADAGEFVEVAAPEGTDLTGWDLVFYNGNGGAAYDTEALTGTVGAAGVVSLAVAGIQNGSPDGIALVNPADQVVEFLSYEGSFTAVGGVADGLTSTDIGVAEAGNEPDGQSLQRTGTGTTAGDFAFTGPAAASPGAVNAGQTFENGGEDPGDAFPEGVFLNEFHYDNTGADADEQIEIAAAPGTDLTGWSVVLYNGNGGAAYSTVALTGVVPESATVVIPTAGLQNGNGDATEPDGIALVDPEGTVTEFISYEGSFTASSGPAAGMTSTDVGVSEPGNTPVGQSLQRIGAGTSAEDYTWGGPFASSFGAVNACQSFDGSIVPGDCAGTPDERREFDDPALCAADATPINQVQGSGDVSPLLGDVVTIEGVVVGDFQGEELDDPSLDGFFVQELTPDADAATSEGVFVYDPMAPQVEVGDVVHLTGTVDEFFGATQIDEVSALSLCAEGTALPVPVPLALPETEREPYEGMLVEFAQDLTVTETYNVGRFGEILLSADGVLLEPTDVADVGGGAEELLAENAARSILLDDGRDGEDLQPVAYLTPEQTIRRGSTVPALTGVLTYGFNAWRIQPTEVVDFEHAPRPVVPEIGGDLRISSFNVLNYFTTLGSRGAQTPEDFEQQEAKIVEALTAIDADVFVLQEIENNDGLAADTLVAALNEVAGAGTWATVENPEGYGTQVGTTDVITNAILYKPAAVDLIGDTATVLIDEAFVNARAPYAATFEAEGVTFTVVGNHFKSKGGCDEATGDNVEQFPGAGCYNGDRIEQANALAGFVEELQTDSGSENVIVLGDLNSYSAEDPIDALLDAGLVNQLVEHVDPADRYTYVFSGEQGVLDHALATPEASERISDAAVWHINADEPRLFEYSGPEGFFEEDPYRASDHDPVLLAFELGEIDEPSEPTDPTDPEEPGNGGVGGDDDEASEDDLAATGADITAIWFGLLLLVAGGALILRRRSAKA